MKKIIAWIFRIACFIVIGIAAFTLGKCLLHMKDDHSEATLMQEENLESFQSPETPAGQIDTAALTAGMEDENPTVVVYSSSTLSQYQPHLTVNAAFGNITNSILAELDWYINDELVGQDKSRLLVEGSTVGYSTDIDVTSLSGDSAAVRLEVVFAGKTLTAETTIPVEAPQESDSDAVIQTEEITVTAKSSCNVYSDSTLSSTIGTFPAGKTGLILEYESNSGDKALHLQFYNDTKGWVRASDVDITSENCTVDTDYAAEVKEDFVNRMYYNSNTDYLVWVNLYTQKVNIFTGYRGNWKLYKCFDCASGLNETPTTPGIYSYSSLKNRWDLGDTYVQPVLIYNGGEAFTSQPYNAKTNKIADDTMGEPASGGSIRLLKEDIEWMSKYLPLDTMVVVY